MTRSARRALRRGSGLVLILHGLAHAVFAYRGSAGQQLTFDASHAMLIVYSTAMIGYVAAGAGLLGVRVLQRAVTPLMIVALPASTVALALGWQRDLWLGLGINAAVATWMLTRGEPKETEVEAAPSLRRRSARAAEAFVVLVVAYVGLAALLAPWHRTWGTTEAEWRMTLPGDPPQRLPATEIMHGISIDAPDRVVWGWLVQLGQDRAGFYSYDWLERLFLADIRNGNEIRREWQVRAPGDRVPATQAGYLGGVFGERPGWRVAAVDPCRALVLEGWGSFVILPEGPGKSRLLVRSRIGGRDAPVAGAAVSFLAFEVPHFIMERGMLRGIKRRAESGIGVDAIAPCASAGARL